MHTLHSFYSAETDVFTSQLELLQQESLEHFGLSVTQAQCAPFAYGQTRISCLHLLPAGMCLEFKLRRKHVPYKLPRC